MPTLHIFNQVRDLINPKICESEDEHVHVQCLQNKNMLKMQKSRLLQFYMCYSFINILDLLYNYNFVGLRGSTKDLFIG